MARKHGATKTTRIHSTGHRNKSRATLSHEATAGNGEKLKYDINEFRGEPNKLENGYRKKQPTKNKKLNVKTPRPK